MEMKRKCNHEDSEIIDQVLRLYRASYSSQAKQVTKELVERAVVMEHNDLADAAVET
jgi:hypothetical protein